jgi:hypothetical protein
MLERRSAVDDFGSQLPIQYSSLGNAARILPASSGEPLVNLVKDSGEIQAVVSKHQRDQSGLPLP